jgi:vitamin B12 transporter
MINKLFLYCKSFRNRFAASWKKPAGIFVLLLLCTAAFPETSSARSMQDMEILQMFYEEKDLFTSVTRTAKPVSQIAENITIVTAKEIRDMTAHSIAEVLNRVNGLFVNFSQGTGTMGSASLFHVQGSEDRHVMVLVDGVPWNSMSGGTAETISIPVGIVERIEIIKGPASSSWGSALGGVVHIITKAPGYASGPQGSLQTAYGENDTMDHRAQVSGRAGRLGYYLFGGRQSSDGADAARDFETDSLYSRFSYALSGRVNLGISFGYTRPDIGLGDYYAADITSSGSMRNFWANAVMDATLSRELTFSLRAFRLEQEFRISNTALGLGYTGAQGEPYQKSVYDEAVTGGAAKLVWQQGSHTAVFGADISKGDLDQSVYSGRLLQSMGAPRFFHTRPDVKKAGIYVNDTIVVNRLSVTPGIRFDDSSVTGSFLSPSLGLTYRLGKETLLRGSVARGFTSPPLSWTSGGALFLNPNASLEEETVWSWQAGMETAALRFVWLKATFFRHDIDDLFELEAGSAGRNFVNKGDSQRQGVEIELETLPFYHTFLMAGAAYVSLDPANDFGAEDIYACNIGVVYDNPAIARAELFGHYIWWDAQAYPDASHDDFVWDVNLSRRVYKDENIGLDLFFTGHNIFNGDQYLVADNPNPSRWFEAGVRMEF